MRLIRLASAAFALVATTPCRAQGWVQTSPDVPPRASDTAMVADHHRGRVVMFGGRIDLGGFRSETWEWDGQSWQMHRTAHGPTGRVGHMLAYDPTRAKTVLFGGMGAAGVLSDTWTYDGFDWREHPVTGPAPRSRHILAFDPTRDRTLVAGGLDVHGVLLGDQWEWDGTNWQPGPVALPPRSEAAACTDTVRNRVLVFGGRSGPLPNDATQDLFEWDGNQWHNITPVSGPARRYDAALAFAADWRRVVLTGGRNRADVPLADTWEWDGTTWRRRADLPWPRRLHATAWHAPTGRVLAGFGYGAFPATDLGDLQAWDGLQWQQVHGARGSEFDGANCAFTGFRLGDRTLALGTRDYNDPTAWWLAWNGHGWQQVSTPGSNVLPDGLRASTFVVDPDRQLLLRFGGRDRTGSPPVPYDALWTWDGTTWTQTPRQGSWPSPRYGAGAAWNPNARQIWLFGGMGNSGPLDDLWLWDGSQWFLRSAATRPPPTFEALLAWDPTALAMMLCGGKTGPTTWMNETWHWSWITGGWTQSHIGGSQQGWKLVGRHPSLNRVVRVGWRTFTGPPLAPGAQYWEHNRWVDLNWLSMAPTSPVQGTLAPDPVRNLLVMPDAASAAADVPNVASASVTTETQGCAAGLPSPAFAIGLPWLGCPAVPLDVSAAPGDLVAIALSVRSLTTSPAPGCAMLAGLDWLAVGFAGPSGFATTSIPVPLILALTNRAVFGQAVTVSSAGFGLSPIERLRIGF
ncbi:MAG: hypothetical protein IPK26_26800 [Planctomycetes bacterium]|nr:hypothetical protein [Planctomycetota bacterium]